MPLPQRIRDAVSQQGTSLLTTGSRFKSFDQVRQRHFWSDLCFLPNANGYVASGDYKAFITPSGQVGQGWPLALTDLETNWKSANRVPDNQNFEVLEVGVTPMPLPEFNATGFLQFNSQPLLPRQVDGILTSSILAIQYLTNEVSIGLANDFQQSSGPMMGTYQPGVGMASPSQNASDLLEPVTNQVRDTRFITNGFCAPGLRRRFKIPILLQHGETFSFNIIVPRTYYFGPQTVNIGSTQYPNTRQNGFVLRIDFWATESFVEKS